VQNDASGSLSKTGNKKADGRHRQWRFATDFSGRLPFPIVTMVPAEFPIGRDKLFFQITLLNAAIPSRMS
jgi:hypothetical protein